MEALIIVIAEVILLVGVLGFIYRVGRKGAETHKKVGGRFISLVDYLRGKELVTMAELHRDTEAVLMPDEEFKGFIIYPVIEKTDEKHAGNH